MKILMSFRFALLMCSIVLCLILPGCKKNMYTVPELSTGLVSEITFTSAKCNYTIISDGGKTISARGVCWSTNQEPTINDNKTTDNTWAVSFSPTMIGLSFNTTYYVRTYATNSEGTGYGEQVSFTTLNPGLPTVTTSAVTNITQTTATCGGNVTNSGGTGVAVTARGLCWGISPNPTIANNYSTNGSGIGSFSYNITGLTYNTTYYVRAYAVNGTGIAYGNEVFFIAGQNITSAILTTTPVSNIYNTYATSGGNISSDGGGAVTARGICWSTGINPTTSNTYITSGSGTGSYTSILTGLTPNTTYHVRAFAINITGTSYGNDVSFKTTTPPTLNTNPISNITSTTATGGGDITNDGGAIVTARGVCWSNSHNPVAIGYHTIDGSGTGTFTSNITGLTINTTYYVRAYATNNAGTAYGNEVSFTTALAIGESYQGGIIAYILQSGDSGYIAGQTHGIIAAPSDQSSSAQWGCYGTLVGGTSTAMGTGQANTTAIVNGCSTSGTAARLCNNLVLGGYSDWYLPSEDELNTLYINLFTIGGFANDFYWSSSETNNIYAWGQSFNNGIQYSNNTKNATAYVRAVRSF